MVENIYAAFTMAGDLVYIGYLFNIFSNMVGTIVTSILYEKNVETGSN